MAYNPKGLYHCINTSHLKGLKITLADKKRKRLRRNVAFLGISSEEKVRDGLRAVDTSPFKTTFVVREETGEVLFALTKNEDYVAAAKKRKKPKPPEDPLPPATSECCVKCRYDNGTQAPCEPLDENSCICYNEEGGGTGGLDDPLENLAF